MTDLHGDPKFAVLDNTYLLEKILKYLDGAQLRKCRQVNQRWNEEALSNYPTTNPIYISCYKTRSDNGEQFSQIENTLKKCKNYNWFLNNLKVRRCCNYRTTMSHPSLLGLLQIHGHYIKVLDIQLPNEVLNCTTKSLIHKILTKWCLNITQLKLNALDDISDFFNDSSENENENQLKVNLNEALFNVPLKLQTLSLGYYIPIMKIVLLIIEASPRLSNLSVDKFYIEYNKSEPLKGRNILLKLAPQLKTFECGNYGEGDTNFLRDFLSEMCNLQELKLGLSLGMLCNFPSESVVLKMRNSLKFLSLDDIVYTDYKLDYGTICVANYFPNLETFILKYEGFDLELNPKFYFLKETPHKNLKKLLILNGYNEISTVTELADLVVAFPNLDFLRIDFQTKGCDWEMNRNKLKNVISTLGGLKKLKELFVAIYMKETIELAQGLELLSKLPALQTLSIELKNYQEIEDNKSFGEICFTKKDLEQPLLNARHLQQIRLVQFQDFCSPSEQEKISCFATENGISLQFKSSKYIREERPRWYY